MAVARMIRPVVVRNDRPDAGRRGMRLFWRPDGRARKLISWKETPLDELDPDEGPPPRVVQPWTRVTGHVVTAGGRFCSCGRSSSSGEAAVAHIRDAWPLLVPKEDGEDLGTWRQRIAVAHGEALEERERIWQEHGMGEPTLPGQPLPSIPDAWARADDRVQVLEQQMIAIDTRRSGR